MGFLSITVQYIKNILCVCSNVKSHPNRAYYRGNPTELCPDLDMVDFPMQAICVLI
jgi:hypothetical protein